MIAFSFARPSMYGTDNCCGIYLANLDGGDIRLLAGTGNNGQPMWSPDGNSLAFYSHREDGEGIYVVEANGDGLELLSESWAIDWSPSWSPDGEWITFVSTQNQQSQDVYIMRTDGTQVTNLTEGSLEPDIDPVWSPVALPRLLTAITEMSWGEAKQRH
jgi:Tol biopolymer transport system component